MFTYPGEVHSNPLVFFPRKLHGQRSLASYSPWGHKELDMTNTHTCSHMCLISDLEWNLSRMLQKSEWISFILLFVVSLNVFLILKRRKNYWCLKKFPSWSLAPSLGTEISLKSQNFNFNWEKTTNATATRKAQVLWRVSVWSICPFSLFEAAARKMRRKAHLNTKVCPCWCCWTQNTGIHSCQ